MLRIQNLSEHTGEDAVSIGAKEHGLGAELVLHGRSGILDLRMLVDHVDHNVGAVGELVHVLTIVTGITAVRGKG